MHMKPFSGLTLIIHLLVIAIGNIVALFVSRKIAKSTSNVVVKDAVAGLYRALSISIIFILSLIMITFFSVAIRTSVREGANEWQRRQMRVAWSYIEHKVYELETLGGIKAKGASAKVYNTPQPTYISKDVAF